MSHYTGAVPDALVHTADWLEQAACRGLNDDMYPDSNTTSIAWAKAVCASCNVTLTCLRDAIRTGDDQHGIRGALKPEERRKVARLLAGRPMHDAALQAAVEQVRGPSAGRTLRDLWNERTHDLPDGHLGWNGGSKGVTVSFQGRVYTPKQIAFQIGRGHPPKGIVRRTCDVDECIDPRHLADNTDRHRAWEAAEEAAGPRRKPGRPRAEATV